MARGGGPPGGWVARGRGRGGIPPQLLHVGILVIILVIIFPKLKIPMEIHLLNLVRRMSNDLWRFGINAYPKYSYVQNLPWFGQGSHKERPYEAM